MIEMFIRRASFRKGFNCHQSIFMMNAKNIQAAQQREEQARDEKLEKTRQQVKESTEFYNKDAKQGSLAAKAAMVAKYNEKHNK